MNEGGIPAPVGPLGKRIVIAEDDPFISRMYQAKLEIAGYGVTLVGNGRDAFETIRNHRPNLAMIDINMPELTGLEVMHGLEAAGYDMASTKFIILTNSGNPKDREAAGKLGAEFMIKAETTPRGVLDHINQLLGVQEKQSG